ncbi:MAG: heavy metal translocating P-type ATPase, partial [Cetobacterium sp.]
MKENMFKVEGMSCSSCSGYVERTVGKLEGVIEASVNLATEKMFVKFDENKISLKEIEDSVQNIGFKAIAEEDIDISKSDNEKEKEIENLFKRFIVSALFAVPLLIISMSHMIGYSLPSFISPEISPKTFSVVQFLLTTPIMLIGNKFFRVGIKSLYKKSPNMDSLISIGTSAAYLHGIFSIFKIFNGEIRYVHELYFESAGTILLLITLGKYLESVTKGKTSEAIKKLMGLVPKTARLEIDGKEVVVQIEDVKVGDILIIKPGDKIPVDGVVVTGNTSIDESMLTGESIPVEKSVGSEIIGASINKNGSIKYRATRVGKDTALAQIIKLVEDAQGSKAPIAKLADIISGYFVPVVIALAIISGFSWYIATKNPEFALTIFISVLVIACPCALGLATPTAIMIGTGKGAEYGILIKSGSALESAHKIKTIVFDKTGTITEGKPVLTDIITAEGIVKDELLKLAASAEKGSEHPLGDAIVKYANDKKLELKKVEKFLAVPGLGIKVSIEEKDILLGNEKLMLENSINCKEFSEISEKLALEGKTPMF